MAALNLSTAQKRAVFVGCARDCSTFLPAVLENLESLAGLFRETAFIFIENDSGDDTKEKLLAWCAAKPNASVVSIDGLARQYPERTKRLAAARNVYLEFIKSDCSGFDYLFVLDTDDINVKPLDRQEILRALLFLDSNQKCAGIFANSTGHYYDLWALRHKTICPGDVWEELCDYVIDHGVSDDEACQKTIAQRLLCLNPEDAPLEVESAFGGLGIYKIQSVVRNRNVYSGWKVKRIPSNDQTGGSGAQQEIGWQVCEHVSFHQGFIENGEKLFVFPSLVNYHAVELARAKFPASAWRTFAFSLSPVETIQLPFFAPKMKPHMSRNQSCSCGSGKKYKHCHGKLA